MWANAGDGICAFRAALFLLRGVPGQRNHNLIPALNDLLTAAGENYSCSRRDRKRQLDQFLEVSWTSTKWRKAREKANRSTRANKQAAVTLQWNVREQEKDYLNNAVVEQTNNWLRGKHDRGIEQDHIGAGNGNRVALRTGWFDRNRVYYSMEVHDVWLNYRLFLQKEMPLNLAPMISCDPRILSQVQRGTPQENVAQRSVVSILVIVTRDASNDRYVVRVWQRMMGANGGANNDRNILLSDAIRLCIKHTKVAPRMSRYTGGHYDTTLIPQCEWDTVYNALTAADLSENHSLPEPFHIAYVT
jgi:hypothetical protein